MRTLLTALVLLLVAASCWANPWIPADGDWLKFDFGGGSNCVWPAVGETLRLRLVLDDLCLVQTGINGIAGSVYWDFSADLLDARCLLAGAPGDSMLIVSAGGQAVFFQFISFDECSVPDESGSIPVVALDLVYTGVPGTIWFEPWVDEWTPGMPSGLVWYTMPEGGGMWYPHQYYFDFEFRGGVGAEPLGGCTGTSVVSDLSWGAIKALYR